MTEEKKPRGWGSMTCTTHVYAVEARAKFGVIVLKVGKEGLLGLGVNAFASEVLTPHEWHRMSFREASVGVPNRLAALYPDAAQRGFLSYQAAMALACWVQAQYEASETRLVCIEYKSSYSTREIGVSPSMDLFEEGRQLLWYLRGDKGGRVRSALPDAPQADDAAAPGPTDE